MQAGHKAGKCCSVTLVHQVERNTLYEAMHNLVVRQFLRTGNKHVSFHVHSSYKDCIISTQQHYLLMAAELKQPQGYTELTLQCLCRSAQSLETHQQITAPSAGRQSSARAYIMSHRGC